MLTKPVGGTHGRTPVRGAVWFGIGALVGGPLVAVGAALALYWLDSVMDRVEREANG